MDQDAPRPSRVTELVDAAFGMGEASDTRSKYPDDTIPGWLRKIRDEGTTDTARAALLYGSERRTVEIAQERLDALEAEAGGR